MVTDRDAKTHLIFLIADTFLTSEEHTEALLCLDDIYDQLKTQPVADVDVSSDRVKNFIHIAVQIIKLGQESQHGDRTVH